MKLTIAIPTFEREAALSELLNQLATVSFSLQVEILVVDNDSKSYDVEALVEGYKSNLPELRLIRNPVNLGMAANFLECYRAASGDWIWLLGDDDAIEVSAIPAIETSLRAANIDESAAAINFSSNFTQHKVASRLRRMEDLPAERSLFRNLLFLSASVVRKRSIFSKLAIGYQLAGSMAPQLGLLLSQLPESHILLDPVIAVKAKGVRTSWSVDDFLSRRGDLLGIATHCPALGQIALQRFVFVDRQPLAYYLRQSEEAREAGLEWHLRLARFIIYADVIRRPLGWKEAVLSFIHLLCCSLGLPHYRLYRLLFAKPETVSEC
jgi:glycosyltransferase involved in cell wall biosynthesis